MRTWRRWPEMQGQGLILLSSEQARQRTNRRATTYSFSGYWTENPFVLFFPSKNATGFAGVSPGARCWLFGRLRAVS